MTENYIKWREYYTDIGLPEHLVSEYESYVKKMEKIGPPPIFEFHHLALLLGVNNKFLGSAVNSPGNHYRSFFIKKKTGGKRIISAPYPTLQSCQNWIKDNILKVLPIHQNAHGFTPGKSIKTNATVHLDKTIILNMDMENFFPSIAKSRIIKIFADLGFPNNVAYYLGSLCCLDDILPQGAPTSPALSNLVCFKMDDTLRNLSKKHNVFFTRGCSQLG